MCKRIFCVNEWITCDFVFSNFIEKERCDVHVNKYIIVQTRRPLKHW